ncbi:hypothetical protein JW752_01880 [Candidatus Peregrinibacteria bacterium]|nr:hypothetical protein [Candidatus Peregrinibacteria bacterium]
MWEEFKEKVNAIYGVGETLVNIIMFLINLPEVLAAKVLLVTNHLPWNIKLDGDLAFIKWIIFAYALFMWGRKIWGIISITSMVPILGWIIRVVVGYSLIVALITLVSSGIWSAMALLLITMFFFNRSWFSSIGKGTKALGRGSAGIITGAARLSGGAIRSMGTIKAFRGNPKAKIIANCFGDLYEGFQNDPSLQKHGMFDAPAFMVAMEHLRDGLTEDHPDDHALIDTMYNEIQRAMDLRESSLEPLAEVARDTMIRMA